MAKLQVKYICQDCGSQYPRWMGRCEQCGNWNTLVEEVLETSANHKKVNSSARPSKVTEISEVDSSSNVRISSGISEFDQVLGGSDKGRGFVQGALVLLGGDPGIGKSTVILQIAANIENTLYISGEESEKQIQMRSERLGIKRGIKLASETNMDIAMATILAEKPQVAVIDSVQTMYSADIPGAPGSVSQLSLCASKLMNLAKKTT